MKKLTILLTMVFMLGSIGISQADNKHKITPKITPEIIFVPMNRSVLKPTVMSP